ncbi:uncharacterized protein JCM15063_001159 [Sporobolomyces koalae]|uniref:uncharacterized protein n=1 Tax=Sporobolomyces koalae TaxID=500713 RepID=UPI00316D59A9
MLSTAALAGALLATAPLQAHAAYDIVRDYSGKTFFDGWSFYGHYDNLTNGDVNFVNQSASSSLAYINEAGNAVIKVSQEEVLYPNKRDSVRISTVDSYGLGSVWIYNALAVPSGCSVWGALWSQAENWPQGGEIDTFETVNLMEYNQMALHTTAGCSAVNSSSSVQYDATLMSSSCDVDVNFNAGCEALDPSPTSAGQALAAAGGGLWATEYASTGIKIWHFQHSAIPADISSNSSSIDPTSWGTPTYFVPNSSCDIEQHFAAQKLVIDITLCGDWAGSNATLAATGCALTTEPICYTQYVLNASNYDNAFFEIPYVRVYQDPSVSHSTSSSNTTSTSGSSSGSSSSSSDSSSKKSSTGTNGGPSQSTNLLTLLATGLAVIGWTILA